MKVYYLQSEFQPGKHRIAVCVYDRDSFQFDTSVLSPCTALVIDELDPANKALCLDLARTSGKADINGEGKYYVDSTGALMEVAGWQEVFNG